MAKNKNPLKNNLLMGLPEVLGKHLKLRLQPGSSPGIEAHIEVHTGIAADDVVIEVYDYCKERVEHRQVQDIEAFFEESTPAWADVRWINVIGLHPLILSRMGRQYGLHTLALEDVLNVTQRPKIERFDEQNFLVLRTGSLNNGALSTEQISLFQNAGLVVTFQEREGDPWSGVRERLTRPDSRLRERRSGYLVYALIDAIVDLGYPALEHYANKLEDLELEIADNPQKTHLETLHQIKRDIVAMRRILWPTREVADNLYREGLLELRADSKTYLRDVYDNCLQLMDMIDALRETTSSLMELYLSMLSHKMNEVMRVLTVIATIFIPITFLAGVYGMNFDVIPELHWQWAYPVFWAVVIVTVALLVWWFRRNQWL